MKKMSDEHEYVIVYKNTRGHYLKTVEIFTVEDNSWRSGTDLPHKVGSFAAALPFQDTFIIAGGYESKTIYKVIRFTHEVGFLKQNLFVF